MKMNAFQLIPFLLACLLIASCGDETSRRFKSDAIVIEDSERLLISYQENDEEMRFYIEDLPNTSNNLSDVFPAIDFITMRVDVNNNGVIDADIDKQYAYLEAFLNGGCVSYLLTSSTITPCNEELGVTIIPEFTSTDRKEEEHIVYELIMRKEDLSTSNEVGLIFKLSGTDASGDLPALNNDFEQTITVSW